jgi:transcriptional regulator with XRE-family HTH domain
LIAVNHLQIKYTLEFKGVSMRSIAKKLGVSPNAVSLVCKKEIVSDRIMTAVADAMGVPKEFVFDEHYLSHSQDGQKRRRGRPRKEYPKTAKAVNV